MSSTMRPVDSPRHRWLSAAAAALLGALLGGGALAAGLVTGLGKLPSPTTEFTTDRPTTANLDRAGEWAIYADSGDLLPPTARRCSVTGPGGEAIDVTTPSTVFETNRGKRHWIRVASFETSAAGPVTVKCAGSGVKTFAVGPQPDIKGFTVRLVAGIVGLVVALLAGIATAIALLLRGRRRPATPTTGHLDEPTVIAPPR